MSEKTSTVNMKDPATGEFVDVPADQAPEPVAPLMSSGRKLVRRFRKSEPRRPNTFDGTLVYEGLMLNVDLPDDEEYQTIVDEEQRINEAIESERVKQGPGADPTALLRKHKMPFHDKLLNTYWKGVDGFAVSEDEKADYQYADRIMICDLIVAKSRIGVVGINFSSGS